MSDKLGPAVLTYCCGYFPASINVLYSIYVYYSGESNKKGNNHPQQKHESLEQRGGNITV